MLALYDKSAKKKATNLTVNSDLLRLAKELKVNLSHAFEKYLEELVREKRRQSWEKENEKAIDDYNTFLQTHGHFSDGLRNF